MKPNLLIRPQTAKTFLLENLIDIPHTRRDIIDTAHPSQFMKDTLIFKKGNLEGVETVSILIEDETRNTRSKLINTFIYEVSNYDDVGLKLQLIDFKVELVSEKPTT